MDTLWNIMGNAKEIDWKEVNSVNELAAQLVKPPPSIWWGIFTHPFVVGVVAISATAVIWHYKGQINYFIESRIFKPGKRTRIMQEILDTEKSYVSVLDTIMNAYVEPLIGKYITTESPAVTRSNSANLVNVNVDKETLKYILPPTIEIMKKTNETLLQKLQDRTRYGILDSTCFGDIFLEMAPFLKCYTSFVNNFDAQANQINFLLKSNPKFRTFVDNIAIRNPAADLNNLLICPVQRLPRYVLLFQELLKATPEDHRDRKNVEIALEKLKAITSLLNQNRHLQENLSKVMRVEKKLKVKHDLTRRWIKEGLVTYQAKEPVMCYLFSDCVVLAKKTTFPKYKLLIQIPLLELDFVEPGADLIAGLPNSFVLKSSSRDANAIALTATSPQEAAEWIRSIQDATSKVKREAEKRLSVRE